MAIVAHMDLDAFFAAVEQRENPELRGLPVVVGGRPDGRGVVSTASYEARAYGIRSAMSCAEARRRCPDAIFVPPDMPTYRRWSQEIWALIHAHIPAVEQVGIDEGYLDLTALAGDVGRARDVLEDLQALVQSRLGLDVSLGCSTGKTVAKIASDFDKPRGLVLIPAGHEAAFLAPLAIRALPGVGPVTERRLRGAGIFRIGDLAALDDATATRILSGAMALELRDRARGIDPRPVNPIPAERISISRERTFDADLTDPDQIAATLGDLTTAVIGRLEGRACTSVTVRLRYGDFTTITRACSAHHPTDDPAEITRLARLALSRAREHRDDPIRLLGVRLAGLAHGAQLQLIR